MWKKIALGFVAVLAVLGVVVAAQPSEFVVVRSATIAAPPAEVFAHVNDFHKWEAWSPWAKLDPSARNSYEGAESGVGAVFKWAGNCEVGEGAMTLTESRPNELVRIKLDFVKPFEGTNDVTFTFKPEGDGTAVTWTMTGRKNFVCKAVGLVMDMDAMCGGMFEQGLASLKGVVEGAHAK